MYTRLDDYLTALSNQFTVIDGSIPDVLQYVKSDITCDDIYDCNVSISRNLLSFAGTKRVASKNYLLPFDIANSNIITNKDILIAYSSDSKLSESIANIVSLLEVCALKLEEIMQRISLIYESSQYFGLIYTSNTVVMQRNFESLTITSQSYTAHGYTPLGIIQSNPDLISGITSTEFDNSIVGFKVLYRIPNQLLESNGIYQYYVHLINPNMIYSFQRVIQSKLKLQDEIIVLNYNNVKVRYALNVLRDIYLQKGNQLLASINSALNYLR